MLKKIEPMQKINLKKCIPIRFTQKGNYIILNIDNKKGIALIRKTEEGTAAYGFDCLDYWIPIKELLRNAEEILG